MRDERGDGVGVPAQREHGMRGLPPDGQRSRAVPVAVFSTSSSAPAASLASPAASVPEWTLPPLVCASGKWSDSGFEPGCSACATCSGGKVLKHACRSLLRHGVR